jgi:hypothetical protein
MSTCAENFTVFDEHRRLLRAVADLQVDGKSFPGTDRVRERLLEICRQEGAPYALGGGKPWHGLYSLARELELAGFLRVVAPMAQFHAWGSPAPEAQRMYLEITAAGHTALADALPRRGKRRFLHQNLLLARLRAHPFPEDSDC